MEMELMSPAAKSSSISLGVLHDRAEGAMLASACGDALGWPIEPRGNRVGGTSRLKPQLDFIDWERREGGGWAPHQRHIPAGTYSDDTQLTLAVARSLTRGDGWWEHLTGLELPLWTVYELGGGGAVKRAAQSWAKGLPPWADAKGARRYFGAGANGVVMRILPHAVYGAQDKDFSRIARHIVADGITTHGHPRALVGALAAGYGMWTALRWQGKVGYGDLIERCLTDYGAWSELPDVAEYAPDWLDQANRTAGESYRRGWSGTVDEMLHLLEQCGEAMGRGSLARDNRVLEELGVFDEEGGGAGTRTAAAALYFASRYVTRPPAGLLAAAFARGSDADTIASVTGALLGSLTGQEWIEGLAQDLQDVAYIRKLSHPVAHRETIGIPEPGWEPSLKRRLLDQLRRLDVGDRISLPVFQEAILERTEHPETRSANDIAIWWLQTAIGQRLAISKVTKRRPPRADDGKPEPQPLRETERKGQFVMEEAVSDRPPPPGLTFWIAVPVRDLGRSLALYHDLLGLPIRRRGENFVVFGANLRLEQADSIDAESDQPAAQEPSLDAGPVVGVTLRSPGLEPTHKRLADAGFVVSEVQRAPGEERFRLLDPDGNVIELRALVRD